MVKEPIPAPIDQKSDRDILEYLRRQCSATVGDLTKFAGVTATAIRQRLNRLMEQGLVARDARPVGRGSVGDGQVGRGRPTHRYSLTPAGNRTGGDNYEDLAGVLWSEIRSITDPSVRQGLLQRVVARFAAVYRGRISGGSLRERLDSLVNIMRERDIPFEVQTPDDGGLPVLTALACPYPDLAEQDRMICSMEKMLFSEILGEKVRLSACRLDGEKCCTFEMSQTSIPVV